MVVKGTYARENEAGLNLAQFSHLKCGAQEAEPMCLIAS